MLLVYREFAWALVWFNIVAADDRRCFEIGASMLRQGGHVADVAAATILCISIVNSIASGIGGEAFMVVRSSSTSKTQAFDMRETAPLATSKVRIFYLSVEFHIFWLKSHDS